MLKRAPQHGAFAAERCPFEGMQGGASRFIRLRAHAYETVQKFLSRLWRITLWGITSMSTHGGARARFVANRALFLCTCEIQRHQWTGVIQQARRQQCARAGAVPPASGANDLQLELVGPSQRTSPWPDTPQNQNVTVDVWAPFLRMPLRPPTNCKLRKPWDK